MPRLVWLTHYNLSLEKFEADETKRSMQYMSETLYYQAVEY